jgi:hypothetical protein
MRCKAKHANNCALLLTDGGVASVTSSPARKKALTEKASQSQQEDRILANEDPMKTVPSSAPAGMYCWPWLANCLYEM